MWPRESAKFITERSQYVNINYDGIEKCSKLVYKAIINNCLKIDEFKQTELLPLDKNLSVEELANLLFVIDALNFNFWMEDDQPKYKITYKNKVKSGYTAMVSSIKRAIDEGKPMYDPEYYSKLNLEDVKHIFRSDTISSIPLLQERVNVMTEISSTLKSKFNGTFVSVLQKARGSALKLVEIVKDEFKCFNDVAMYAGVEVSFYKRAQILAADIHMLYNGTGLGAFSDLDQLTMFADYRVPQVLVHFGALLYSQDLQNMLKKEHLFKSGDPEEVEIRGSSIHAVELIVGKIKSLLKDSGHDETLVNSVKVDFFLWGYRLDNAKELNSTPYHRVRCIYY